MAKHEFTSLINKNGNFRKSKINPDKAIRASLSVEAYCDAGLGETHPG
jgi:hypothetical protein